MAFTTFIKSCLNLLLKSSNLRIDTLTEQKIELTRLNQLDQTAHFSRPIFSMPNYSNLTSNPIFEILKKYESRWHDFNDPSKNTMRYTFQNNYFSSPDAEVLYAIVREFRPKNIVEVGSGNSTKIMRQAILDGGLDCKLVSIDPEPRIEISDIVDKKIQKKVEDLPASSLLQVFQPDDILFIDSSHFIKTGNDVVFLYLHLLPKLPAGVLIHIHDIFLPYEYPKNWIIQKNLAFTEQYLVQAVLTFGDAFEVLWPGYYLQQTNKNFVTHLPYSAGRLAQSFWLRKVR